MRAGKVFTLAWSALLITGAILFIPLSEGTSAVEAALGIASLVFWIAMIRHCWLNTEPGSRERWVWLLIVVLGKLPGAFAYYMLRDRVSPAAA